MKAIYRTQLILFVSLNISTAIYAGVLYAVTPQLTPSGLPMPALAGMGVAAVMCALAAWLLRARLMPARGELMPGALEDDRELTEPQKAAVMQLQRAFLLAWSLSEAIAMLGLVAAYLTARLDYYWPFWAAAVASMALHRPRASLVAEVIAGVPDRTGTPGGVPGLPTGKPVDR